MAHTWARAGTTEPETSEPSINQPPAVGRSTPAGPFGWKPSQRLVAVAEGRWRATGFPSLSPPPHLAPSMRSAAGLHDQPHGPDQPRRRPRSVPTTLPCQSQRPQLPAGVNSAGARTLLRVRGSGRAIAAKGLRVGRLMGAQRWPLDRGQGSRIDRSINAKPSGRLKSWPCMRLGSMDGARPRSIGHAMCGPHA